MPQGLVWAPGLSAAFWGGFEEEVDVVVPTFVFVAVGFAVGFGVDFGVPARNHVR